MKKLVLILVIMTLVCIGFAADDPKDTKATAGVQLAQDVASPEITESVSGCTPTEVADDQRKPYKNSEGGKFIISDPNHTSGTYKQ